MSREDYEAARAAELRRNAPERKEAAAAYEVARKGSFAALQAAKVARWTPAAKEALRVAVALDEAAFARLTRLRHPIV